MKAIFAYIIASLFVATSALAGQYESVQPVNCGRAMGWGAAENSFHTSRAECNIRLDLNTTQVNNLESVGTLDVAFLPIGGGNYSSAALKGTYRRQGQNFFFYFNAAFFPTKEIFDYVFRSGFQGPAWYTPARDRQITARPGKMGSNAQGNFLSISFSTQAGPTILQRVR